VTWVELFPAACGLLYLAAAVGYAVNGRWDWTITYGAYAVANVGLILAALRTSP